ncbi:MAG: FAD-dependent monooxygenase, partial [archaeon]|nr:FAD-dependent monooxygenase [archaeon]
SDGGGSRCRQALKGFLGASASDQARPLGYGYKELTLPLRADGRAALATDSLHIWPRGSHFMMALPNRDGSQTVTLYLPGSGPAPSFAALEKGGEESVREYFAGHYPDAAPLMPRLLQEFQQHPVGFLGTVFAGPWVHGDRLALIGDAAHAITPFFGQGCNSGFEDVSVLHRLLLRSRSEGRDLAWVLARYYEQRKPDTDAIAHMALDNFTEMMAKTAEPRFLLEKQLEIVLAQSFPVYASRYALVTHSLIPYSLCQRIGVLQQQILSSLSAGISSPDQLDLSAASRLIDTVLKPFLDQHRITPDMYHYTSKYYPAPRSRI